MITSLQRLDSSRSGARWRKWSKHSPHRKRSVKVASATATKFGLSRGLLGLQYDQINASESESTSHILAQFISVILLTSIHVSLPGISWLLSTTIWIPCQGLSGDAGLRFSQVITYPSSIFQSINLPILDPFSTGSLCVVVHNGLLVSLAEQNEPF